MIAAKAFLNWAIETGRLQANPLERLKRSDEKADRCRVPRALTPDELQRLLDAARRRPLLEAITVRRGWRRGQPLAQIRPETRAKHERTGQERALAYKVMALTGLRLGELSAVRVCDVLLSGPRPQITIPSSNCGKHCPRPLIHTSTQLELQALSVPPYDLQQLDRHRRRTTWRERAQVAGEVACFLVWVIEDDLSYAVGKVNCKREVCYWATRLTPVMPPDHVRNGRGEPPHGCSQRTHFGVIEAEQAG